MDKRPVTCYTEAIIFLQRMPIMKQRLTVPALSAALGLAGFLLRLLQNRTGFEADTGLPISGNVPSVLLPVLLLAAAVILFISARSLPKEPQSFPTALREKEPLLLTVLVLGVFLMAASGIWSLLGTVSGGGQLQYLTENGLVLMDAPTVGSSSARFMGLPAVAAAVSVFPAVAAVRRENISPLSVLAAPVCLLARLILAYRVHSVDPVLADYYPELLSLILSILGFYRLSGFAVSCGALRIYSVYSGLTVVLSLTLLADGITPAALLALGCAAVLMGFLLLLSADAEDHGEAA